MAINARFFVSGIKAAIHLSPNMDTLVSLGSGISFLYSFVNLVFLNGTSGFYFDSAAMILTFISVGKLLETVSKDKSKRAIDALADLVPAEATVIRNGQKMLILSDELVEGDICIIESGESFCADGELLGESDDEVCVDESSLTGESVPVKKYPGDKVYTATINMKGKALFRVEKIGNDTFLSSIIKAVRDSSATKAPIAKYADRVAAVFVPTILGIAIVLFVARMLAGVPFDYALTKSIAVLVVSCPCALGLATPMAVMVGMTLAAKFGILFKNAEALETSYKANTVVLDKTGTITRGDLETGDEIREDSKEAVFLLKRAGKRIVMLTGDKAERAQIIAEKAGIDEVVSEVLPTGKKDVVAGLMKESNVMMVGDGINDAVALVTADVGVAIGCGKDVAIESADVVLLSNSLIDVARLLGISEITMKTIKRNLFFAFIYNIVLIPIAAGACSFAGIDISPMLCAVFMSLSSFCVCISSLSINLHTDKLRSLL